MADAWRVWSKCIVLSGSYFLAGSGSQAGCWVIELSVLDFEKNTQIGTRTRNTSPLDRTGPKTHVYKFQFFLKKNYLNLIFYIFIFSD
jgi:hypothetical protein